MSTQTYIFLSLIGLIGLIALVTVTWRLASRRRSLPCPVWLSWLVELDNPFAKTNRAEAIIRHLDLLPGMSVLDVGCGPGRLTIPIAALVGNEGEVVAMDIQAGMLGRVQEKMRKADLNNIRLLLAGVGDGKLECDKFDRALLVTVLGEIPNQTAAVKEIYNALKPGGILSVTELIFDPHFQTQKSVERLATSIGFRVKTLYGNRLAYTMILEKVRNSG